VSVTTFGPRLVWMLIEPFTAPSAVGAKRTWIVQERPPATEVQLLVWLKAPTADTRSP
jgi:hypothetical protein